MAQGKKKQCLSSKPTIEQAKLAPGCRASALKVKQQGSSCRPSQSTAGLSNAVPYRGLPGLNLVTAQPLCPHSQLKYALL